MKINPKEILNQTPPTPAAEPADNQPLKAADVPDEFDSPYGNFESWMLSDGERFFIPVHVNDDAPVHSTVLTQVTGCFWAVWNNTRRRQVACGSGYRFTTKDGWGKDVVRLDPSKLVKRTPSGQLTYPSFNMDMFEFLAKYKPLHFMSASEWKALTEEVAGQIEADKRHAAAEAAWRNEESQRLHQAAAEKRNPKGALADGIAQGVAMALEQMGMVPKKSKTI